MNDRFDKAQKGLTIIGAIIDIGFRIRDRVRARRAKRAARRIIDEAKRETEEREATRERE